VQRGALVWRAPARAVRAPRLHQVVAQRAADAAVGERHEAVPRSVCQQLCVDVDLGHVVDEHRHLRAARPAPPLLRRET